MVSRLQVVFYQRHVCRTAALVGAVDLTGYTLLPRKATDEQRASISVIVTSLKGFSKRAYCLPNGGFTVYGLTEGEYMIDVAVIGWTFPQYNVQVSSKYHDGVRVTPVNSRVPLEPTVILAPLSEAQYFAKRKPIDVRSYLFSPYGLMMGTSSSHIPQLGRGSVLSLANSEVSEFPNAPCLQYLACLRCS